LLRLLGLAALLGYSFLLLTASLPVVLFPFEPLSALKAGSSLILHLAGVTPGLEVFPGHGAARAIPHMTCFRITGAGESKLVLFDDLDRCRERRVAAIRDPFEVFQVKSLAGPLVDLNLGLRRSLVLEPMQPLFLITDYYCHLPAAERAEVRSVTIESIYLGLSVDDGAIGRVDMAGRRVCRRPTWEIRQP
jgi:hypothetical protein